MRSLFVVLSLIVLFAAICIPLLWAFIPFRSEGASRKEYNYFYDGDTITNVSYRLAYIDAPELFQKCTVGGKEYPIGKLSLLHLIEISQKNISECIQIGFDNKWKRPVVDCGYNLKMVQDGWATCFDVKNKVCMEKEEMAKNNKDGIWACDTYENGNK